MPFSSFNPVQLTNEFIEAHDLDPSTPEVSDDSIERYRRRKAWRDSHLIEASTYRDETFRAFLQRNEYTPEHCKHKGCGDCRKCGASCRRYCECANARKQRPSVTPQSSDDLVFSLLCSDGKIRFGRRLFRLIEAASRMGAINTRTCAKADVVKLVRRAVERGQLSEPDSHYLLQGVIACADVRAIEGGQR